MLDVFTSELTYAFGGCSVIKKVKGYFLSRGGKITVDSVNLICSDSLFEMNEEALAHYASELRRVAFESLNEEDVLVAVYRVYHAK